MNLLSPTQLQYNCINKVLLIDEQYLHIVVSKPDMNKPVETIQCDVNKIHKIKVSNISKKHIIFWSFIGLASYIAFNIYTYLDDGSLMVSWVPLVGVIVLAQCFLIKRWKVEFLGGPETYFWKSQIINSKTNDSEFEYILNWAKQNNIRIQDERTQKS